MFVVANVNVIPTQPLSAFQVKSTAEKSSSLNSPAEGSNRFLGSILEQLEANPKIKFFVHGLGFNIGKYLLKERV